MIKAKVTSKNQLTIPKKIVDYLELAEADKVTFEVVQIGNKKSVLIEKCEERCEVCSGEGILEGIECVVCRGSGARVEYDSIFTHLNDMVRNYSELKFAYSIINPSGCLPLIEIESRLIPQEALERFNDYYQLMLLLHETNLLDKQDGIRQISNKLYKQLYAYMRTELGRNAISALFNRN